MLILDNTNYTMDKKINSLLKDVSDLKASIDLEQKKLKKFQENNTNSEVVKSMRLSIISLQKNLLEAETQLKMEQLEDIKTALSDQLNNNILDNITYGNNIKDINNYITSLKSFSQMQDVKLDLDFAEVNGYADELIKRNKDFFRIKEEDFNNQMQRFVKDFSLHQMNLGKISPEWQQAIISKEQFDLNDINQFFSDLCDSAGQVPIQQFPPKTNKDTKCTDSIEPQQPSKTTSLTTSISDNFATSDIKNISCIADGAFRQKLFNLCNTTPSDNVEILAIHKFENKTLGDLFGMSKEIYEKLHGNDYDRPIGEQIGLYSFNYKTQRIEVMDTGSPAVCISKGNSLNVVHSDSKSIESEVSTMDFAGIYVSFYIDNSGKMCVAQNVNGQLQEVTTQTLDYMESVYKSKQKMSSSAPFNNDVENNIIDLSTCQTSDELHDKICSNIFFNQVRENLLNSLSENEKNVSLQDKSKAEQYEKLDIEKLDVSRGFN